MAEEMLNANPVLGNWKNFGRTDVELTMNIAIPEVTRVVETQVGKIA